MHLDVIVVVTFGQRHAGGVVELDLVASHLVEVNLSLRRSKGGGLDEIDGVVTGNLSREPQEGLLEVVVDLGGDLVVLQVLLSVESNLLGLHLALLDFDLVAAKDNRDILADTGKITVPVGNALVGNTGSDIEHDDGALSLDAVESKSGFRK